MERNDLSNSGRGPAKEQSNQLWLKPTQWLQILSLLNFWLRWPFWAAETILSSLTEICPVVTEELSFEVFSFFSSGSHFVQRNETMIWAIKEKSYQIWLKSTQKLWRRCHLKQIVDDGRHTQTTDKGQGDNNNSSRAYCARVSWQKN